MGLNQLMRTTFITSRMELTANTLSSEVLPAFWSPIMVISISVALSRKSCQLYRQHIRRQLRCLSCAVYLPISAVWRLESASGDIRQQFEHDIRQQEKDDKITVNTYQNKLNSQSYRRLSKPTMTGRPTLSRPSKSVRLLGARSTVECQLSPGQSETQQGSWEEMGERGERTAAVEREDAQRKK
jgi:hypothetical protein